MRVLNAAQMREADRQTIEEVGVPSIVLMENAGRQVVAAMEAAFEDLAGRHVAVLCGRGNNGGDGFVVARTLIERSVRCSVFLIGRAADVRGDARTNLDILGRLGVAVGEVQDTAAWERHRADVSRCGLIVDAIFGTGLNAPLSGLVEEIVAGLNASGVPVVAIDLPTGLSADTHRIPGQSIVASLTVTFATPKIPLVLPPAESLTGELVIADIGIPASVIEGVGGPYLALTTRDRVRQLVRPRPADSHKGEFGHVLVVAGSIGRTGAAHLVAIGALRSGAGLVTVATPRSCLPVVAALEPEYMTEPLDETPDGALDVSGLDRVLALPADVIAVGPGLGRAPGTATFVRGLVDRSRVPLVLDADALNAFAGDPRRLMGRDGTDVIVTPHPGEMARLLGTSAEAVQEDRIDSARTFAAGHGVCVVLKGYRTVVAMPGGRTFLNPTGNPGMATGGTGDVLTGMIAAWYGQLRHAEAACQVAVYLHGLAGDLAARDRGEVAMTAGDLAARLGDAVLETTTRRKGRALPSRPAQ